MTNMLPRDRAEQILADHAAGKPADAIARAYGHSPATIRGYVNGLRTPGEPAPRADDFAPFASYCRQRLADDPHLRTPALLAELSALGLGNARSTLYHALGRHSIQTHPCPDCHPASMSGYSPLAAGQGPQPAPLPVPAAPVAGEALASFLGRLAAVNRTTPKALLEILPPWFRVKARWHDDRWQPAPLMRWADDAAARLAVISGSTADAIKNALPAFGGSRGQPVRAVTACRLCTAARRISQPVPVHLPAHHQVCLRHGIWLSGPGTPQFSVSVCPGRRAPSPPPPSPLHHRAAGLLQDPGNHRPGRPRMEAPDAGPHRIQPPASDRIEHAGTVPCCGLPRNHRRSRRRPAPARKAHPEQSSLTRAAPGSHQKQAKRAPAPPGIDNEDSSSQVRGTGQAILVVTGQFPCALNARKHA